MGDEVTPIQTPAQVAAYDQALATIESNLDVFIDMFRAELADGQHEGVSVAGLGRYFLIECDPEVVAEVLAVAVRRLANSRPATD